MYSTLLYEDVTTPTQTNTQLDEAVYKAHDAAIRASTVGETRLRLALNIIVDVALSVVNTIGFALAKHQSTEKIIAIAYFNIAIRVFVFIIGSLVQRLYHGITRILNNYKKIQQKMLTMRPIPYKSLPFYLLAIGIGATIGYAVAKAIFGERMSKELIGQTIKDKVTALSLLYLVYEIAMVVLIVQFIKLRTRYPLHSASARAKLASSNDPVQRALARAYDLTKTAVPEFANRKVYVGASDGGPLNAFCMSQKSIYIHILNISAWRRHFTEEELTAVFLHELGHAVTLGGYSLMGDILYGTVSMSADFFYKTDALHSIGFHLINGLRRGFASLRKEVLADSFAVRFDYGPHLQSALRKIHKLIELGTGFTSKVLQKYVHAYVSHYSDTHHRIKMIQKMIDARAEVLRKTFRERLEQERSKKKKET
jgi:Zn-dependent protease with chaperone function